MSENRSGVALTVFLLEAGQALLSGGMISQAEDGRFSKGPREMGLAHWGAGAACAFAVRGLGARDQTTVGGKLLDPREAVDVVDFIAQYETAKLADAWDGLPQLQGVGSMLSGG